MDVVLVVARIVLAGIWLVAGIGKLLDWKTVPPPLVRLGLPGWISRTASLGLPLIELMLAALLLSGSTAWFGAIGSVALLTGFVVVLAVTTGRGSASGCGCLGRFERVVPPVAALIRTELLAALAAGIVWFGWHRQFPSLTSWLTPSHGWQWAVIMGAVGAVALRRPLAAGWSRIVDRVAWQTQSAMTPSAGLPVGTPAPISYRPQGLEALVFVRDLCVPCEELLGAIPPRATVTAMRILSISGRGAESARFYRVPGVPAAVLIGPDGRIASPLAVGAVAIRTLLDRG